MTRNNTFIIAQEGWKYLIAFAIAYLLLALMDAGVLQTLLFIAAVFTLLVYRNPERQVPHFQDGSIIIPADGEVIDIDQVERCPWIEGRCHKVTIRTGCLDASLLRVPFDATIEKLEHHKGARLSLNKVHARAINESARLYFRDQEGHEMVIEHLLEQSPDPISLRLAEGRKVVQGSRYGLIVKGTHTLYLPAQYELSLRRGERVYAGETLAGYFSD